MFELEEEPDNAADTLEVALARVRAEARHCHHCGGDVQTAEGHGPLEGPDQGLVFRDTIFIKFGGQIQLGMVVWLERGSTRARRALEETSAVVMHPFHVLLRGLA